MDSNKIFRVAKNEYIKWITNPKMIIALVMFVFAYDYVIKELSEASDKMGEKLQIFEGFIAISNSQLLIMIIPIVFIGLMGEFPRVDGNSMFFISRVGKVNWLLGQMMFAIMASVTYLGSLLLFSMLASVGRSYLANNWSEVTTKYYIFAPNDFKSKVAMLTTGRLYNNLTPVQSVLNIFGLMLLLMLLIAMGLLVSFVLKNKITGVIATTGLICLGNVLAYMENGVRWFFPTSHAVLEIHFDEIYRKPIMGMEWSYLYYLVLIMILFVISFVLIDRYDFSKIQELEE